MIGRKRFTLLGIAFLLMSLLIINFPQAIFAESRHLAQKYGFGPTGNLLSSLVVNFGNVTKNVYVNKKYLDEKKSLLLVAFPLDKENVFTLQMFNSETYSIYRVNLRDSHREEIVVMGLGEANAKKVRLQEIYVIGTDGYGNIVAMPVKGFSPVDVLNTPLQLDGNRNIVLPLDGSGKLMRIYWDISESSFIAGYIEKAEKTPSKNLSDSYSETVEDSI